jgi:uncharacterized cupredoxin-like copper-binding protein
METGNNKMAPIRTLSKKSARTALLSAVGIIALTGLAACGGTPTSDVQPTPTTAIVQVEPTATQDMDMVMDETATPAGAKATPTTHAQVDATATTAQTDPPQSSGAETEVQATLREWAIDLSQSEVPAGKVKFTITNQGQMMHNLTIQDSSGVVAKTPNFDSSQGAQTLEVELQPGTYTLLCSLPGHAARGQMTQLTVK